MCLHDSEAIKDNRKKGYAFKTVCTTPVHDEFTGKWKWFRRDGGGIGVPDNHKSTCINRIVWKIGRLYRVKHNRSTRDFNHNKLYPAGVHLYKNWGYTNSERGFGEVILVCYYTSATHEDTFSTVARRVTPVLALCTKEEQDNFGCLLSTRSIAEAVKVFKTNTK